VVAEAAHDVGQLAQVLGGKGVEEQLPGDLDVTGQDAGEPGAAGVGDGDKGGALVIRAGAAGDEPGLGQQAGLVGEAAAAVNDAVGAQLLVEGVLQEAEGLAQREVSLKLLGLGGVVLAARPPTTLPGSNSKSGTRER
jgi:hypothetical protein